MGEGSQRWRLPALVLVVGMSGKLGVDLVRRTPQMLLKVPNIGFILYAMAGGNSGYVPPYFNNTAYRPENFRSWARDNDVIVATGAKSGTTWMLYCADAIRRKGADDVGLPYTDVQYTTPWMELEQQPGLTFAYQREQMDSRVLPDGTRLKDYWDHQSFPYRVFKSHFGPKHEGGHPFADVLPIREYPKVKYVAAVRHPYEVAKSMLTFFPNHMSSFQQMWGGFPPVYASADDVLKDMLPGGNLYDLYFPYVRSWWQYRDDPNVLLLHYRDMTQNLTALVDKLSQFLEVPLNAQEKARVLEKCSFAHMKEHNHCFDYRLPLNGVGVNTIMQPSTHVNKGKSEKVELGKDVKAKWEAVLDTELPDSAMRQWAYEGGAVFGK